MALQPITGYPSDYRAPFTAAQINFGQGPSTAGGGKRVACYVMPMTSSGTGTAGTLYEVKREQDAIDIGGVGSPLHRAVRMHFMVNQLAKVYVIPYAATVGGSPATATGTLTFTLSSGSNPAAKGFLETFVSGEQILTPFDTSDTVTTIAARLKEQINAKQFLPYTSNNSSGVLTLTARIAGASQGDGTVGVHRFRCRVITVGTNVLVAASGAALGLGTGTAGADGSTTENTNFAAAIANFTTRRFYYMGMSQWSATAVDSLKAHIVAKSDPNPGLRSRGFSAYTGTAGNVSTLAITPNYERHHIVWQRNSEHDTAELVAQAIAIHQKKEEPRGGFVDDNYRGNDWFLKPCYTDSDAPTEAEKNDAIVDGVMVIGSDSVGSFLVMSVNTRSKNSGGTIDDFRATETHRVSFMDDFVDTWLARHNSTYTGFVLTADRLAADGSVDVNQELPEGKVLTPSLYQSFPSGLINEFWKSRVLQRPEDWIASLRINIDPLNASRLECGASGRTFDIHHQTTINISETSPG